MLYSQPSGGVMRGTDISDIMVSNTARTWMCDAHGFAALQQWEGEKVAPQTAVNSLVYRMAFEDVKQYGDCSADVTACYNDEESGYENGYLLTRPFFFRHVYRPTDQYPVKMTLHKVTGSVASSTQTGNPHITTSLQDSQNLGLRFVPILVNTDGLCIPLDSFTNDVYDVKLAYSSTSPAGTVYKDTEFLFATHDSAHTTKQDFMIVGGMFVYNGLDSNQTVPNFISPDSGRFVGQKSGITEVTVTGCVVAGNHLSDYPSDSELWLQAPSWASNNVYQLTLYGDPYESRVSVQSF